jgi:hypothetical protein
VRAYEFISEDDVPQGDFMAANGQLSAMGSTNNRGITKKRKKMKEVEQLIKETRTTNARGASR